MIEKEKRSERLNLSLTPEQYKVLVEKSKKVRLKPIQFATQAVLGKNILSLDSHILISLLLQDYRKQIGFSKLLLRDCELTDEAERIANATINDFIEKIEKLERVRRGKDGNRSNN